MLAPNVGHYGDNGFILSYYRAVSLTPPAVLRQLYRNTLLQVSLRRTEDTGQQTSPALLKCLLQDIFGTSSSHFTRTNIKRQNYFRFLRFASRVNVIISIARLPSLSFVRVALFNSSFYHRPEFSIFPFCLSAETVTKETVFLDDLRGVPIMSTPYL